MLQLFYLPGTAAMVAQAAVEEVGLEYVAVPVVREQGRTVSPSGFLELNPHGRVPTLVDGDLVLYEAAAIVLHLGDRHPESGLLPPPRTDARSHAFRWLAYLTNTVQATFMWWFYPERFVGDDEAACQAIVAGTTRQLDAMFHWIDSELGGREYVLGEFSGVDLYLHMVTRWGRNLPRKAWTLPNLGAHYALLSERPSVARMMQRQGIVPYPEQ
jgi:glutathione S-transferase